MTIKFLIGPPCSGKTTWCKQHLKSCSYIRVNRDELRIMLKGRYVVGNKVVESICNDLVIDSIYRAYKNNTSIIIDATHCKFKYITDIQSKINLDNVSYSYTIFKVPYWKQRYRNFFRYLRTGIWIPKEVSKNMNKNFNETIKELDKRGIKYYIK